MRHHRKRTLVLAVVAALAFGGAAANAGPQLWKGRSVSAAILAANGAGWSGITATPTAQGNSGDYGYADQAIARFDTVPYQTIGAGETLHIGVIAFHQATVAEQLVGAARPVPGSNIAKVSVSVDGGTWTDVTTATVNADEGVTEYNFDVRAADFPDGAHEARAIVYPATGAPVVLQGGSIVDLVTSASISGTTLTFNNTAVTPAAGMSVGGPGVANSTVITGACTVGASTTTCPVTPSQMSASDSYRIGQTPGLPFTTNSGGSLSAAVRYVSAGGTDSVGCGTTSSAPCATINKAMVNIRTAHAGSDVGGGTVCVQAGTFPYAGASANFTSAGRWLNVVGSGHGPCDAVGAGAVYLTNFEGGANDMGVDKTHFAYVNLVGTATLGGFYSSGHGGGALASFWFDHSAYVGKSFMTSELAASVSQLKGGMFCTESSITIAGDGCLNAIVARNMTVSHIGSDAFQSVELLVNSTVTYNGPAGGTADIVSGSAVVTNFAGAVYVQPGDCLYNATYLQDTSCIFSVDSATQVTFNKTAILSGSNVPLTAGANFAGRIHSDVWQHAGNSFNWIAYGLTANDTSNGSAQGVFPDGSVFNLAVVNVKALNNTGGYVFQTGTVPQGNWVFSGNNWTGNMQFGTTGTASYADLLIYRDTCTVSTSHTTGITVTQSPSC